MFSVEYLQNKVKQVFDEINLQDKPCELYDPIVYTIKNAGKRIRPLLTLLASDMFNGNIDNAIYPSVGIEMFHNFTLLHDDIMDNAPLRRGKETVYRKWNTNIAILSGDTMFALAYNYLLMTESVNLKEIFSEFNKAAIKVCEGQQLDMNYESVSNVSISDYIFMIRSKTAVLLAASLKIGAIIGGANKPDAENMFKFGENIGIAFQIMDDLLDVYGKPDKFGKQNCGDIRSDKKTFLYLKAYELANAGLTEKLNYFINNNNIDPDDKINGVKLIYDELDIKAHSTKEIDKYYNEALKYFDLIKIDKERKSELLNFTKNLMGRVY